MSVLADDDELLINPWDIYGHPAVGWHPHPFQEEIEDDFTKNQTRHQVVAAGRRFGKSNLGGHRPLPFIFLAQARARELAKIGKRMEIWIVGPEYSDGEKEFRVFYNKCRQLGLPFDRPGTYNSPLAGNMHVSLWDGAFQLHVKSAKYPDTLVGEELTGVIMAEAAKLKPAVWSKYIRPMLNDQKGWSLHTSTPEGKNHFYDKYIRGQRTSARNPWRSWRIPAWRNTGYPKAPYEFPTVDEHVKRLLDLVRKFPSIDAITLALEYKLVIDPEILSLIDELSVEEFKQEIGADFTEYVGKVFKDFDPDYHCGNLKFNPSWETFAAIDYGFRNPNVWLLGQHGPDGEINFLDEVYVNLMHINEFAKEIRRRGLNPDNLTYIYPDPARPDETAVLVDELKVKPKGGTGGELSIRLNLIRKALKRGIIDNYGVLRGNTPGRSYRPQMMFDLKCTRTIDDFEKYRYGEEKNDGKQETSTERFENPLKIDDHGPEAVGRFMAGRFGESLTEPPRTSRVANSRVTRRGPGTSTPNTSELAERFPELFRQKPLRKPIGSNRIAMHERDGYEYRSDDEIPAQSSGRSYYDEDEDDE